MGTPVPQFASFTAISAELAASTMVGDGDRVLRLVARLSYAQREWRQGATLR